MSIRSPAMQMTPSYQYIAGLCLSVVLSFCIGGIVTMYAYHPQPPFEMLHAQEADTVPVVTIEGIRNSALIGTVQGNARLVANGHVIQAGSGGAFSIRDNALLTNNIVITIPPGMRFVASRRGSKFYPVESDGAQRIVPENRVYFADEESAIKAGFVR